MKIQNPKQIVAVENLDDLLTDVDKEIAKFKDLGEFPPEVVAEIQRAFLPERISDTLNIEGVRVNPRVTRAILEGLGLSESDRYTEGRF